MKKSVNEKKNKNDFIVILPRIFQWRINITYITGEYETPLYLPIPGKNELPPFRFYDEFIYR